MSLLESLRTGGPAPVAPANIPLVDLVPRHCLRCPLWERDDTRKAVSRLHLWALHEQREPAALAFSTALYDLRGALKEDGPAAARLIRAAQGLQASQGVLNQMGAHRDALAPLQERAIQDVARFVRRHPEALFAGLGLHTEEPLDGASWAAYLEVLRSRLDAEDGDLEVKGDRARMRVRDVAVSLVREEVRTASVPGDWEVVVTARPLPAGLLGRADGVRPFVVRLLAGATPVLAPPGAPLWLRRLLDPSPNGPMMEALQQRLIDGPAALALRAPFLTVSELDGAWPRTIILSVFRRLATDGRYELREVEGVGPTLIPA